MQTLIGTSDHPWLDLSPHVDIEGLKNLRMEIIKGIALSEDTFPSAYGVLLDPLHFKDGFHSTHEVRNSKNHQLLQTFQGLINMAGSAETKRRRALLFSNLYTHAYSGGWSVPIRMMGEGVAYDAKNSINQTRLTANATHFGGLLAWINKLPFQSIGRINIFVNTPYAVTPIHRDGRPIKHRNEFMWLCTEGKDFFLYDSIDQWRYHMSSPAVFFDERTWHGTEACPHYQFSIRIDGVYTDDFRCTLGLDKLDNYCAEASKT